jgi:CHU_C Type IX secretion signal domain
MYCRCFFIVLFSLMASFPLLSQCNAWEKLVGYRGVSIADTDRDSYGNLYVVGSFFIKDFIIDDTPIPFRGTYYSIFILKLDRNDNLLWAKSAGDGSASFVDVDSDNNIIVSGGFYAPEITFDCVQLVNSSARSDVFVVKFSSDGFAIWGEQSHGPIDEWPSDQVVTLDGTIIISAVFVAAEGVRFGQKSIQSFGGYDSFIASITGSGNVSWTLGVGGPGGDNLEKNFPDYIHGIDVDALGNVFITGMFESPQLYIGNFTLLSKTISENFFFAKIDVNGNVVWTKEQKQISDCGGFDVAVDNKNNIHVTGRFYANGATFDNLDIKGSGAANVFLVKYDTYGNVLLAKSYGGNGSETGLKITVDRLGNILLEGLYSDIFSLDSFTLTNPSTLFGQLFIATLDEQFNAVCLIGTSGEGNKYPLTIKTDSNNNIMATVYAEWGTRFDTISVSDVDISSYVVFIGNNNVFDPGSPTFNFSFDLGLDIVKCSEEEIKLEAEDWCGAEYLWSNGSVQKTITTKESGLYWLDIKFRGVTIRDSIRISNYPTVSVDLGDDLLLCNNESILLSVSQPVTAVYTWNDGTIGLMKSVDTPGLYWVKVKDKCGFDYDSIQVKEIKPLSLDLGGDKSICKGEILKLNASTPGASSYLWHDGSELPEIDVIESKSYVVKVSNDCESIVDSVHIRVVDVNSLLIPNVVTANGDGKNDSFQLPDELQGIQLSVYNRWGQNVFSTEYYYNLWGGENLASGVYYFLLRGGCIKEDKKGYVHLIKD